MIKVSNENQSMMSFCKTLHIIECKSFWKTYSDICMINLGKFSRCLILVVQSFHCPWSPTGFYGGPNGFKGFHRVLRSPFDQWGLKGS